MLELNDIHEYISNIINSSIEIQIKYLKRDTPGMNDLGSGESEAVLSNRHDIFV